MHWLKRSIAKFGLKVLNFCVTDNHIHLIVHPRKDPAVIARSMHLIAGSVGREYNERMRRKGAFWEDRYHATAVQSGEHLLRCLLYVDLNMVRAGVVHHPSEWDFCGYRELAKPLPGTPVIDRASLLESTGIDDWDRFSSLYRQRLDNALSGEPLQREELWTKSIAVGDETFVGTIKQQLRHRARNRTVEATSDSDGAFVLKEPAVPYHEDIAHSLAYDENTIPWAEEEAAGVDERESP